MLKCVILDILLFAAVTSVATIYRFSLLLLPSGGSLLFYSICPLILDAIIRLVTD
jgi:hypothetical protein